MATDACPPEPDSGDMYWEYKGDGSLLVARSYTACEDDCEDPGTYDAFVRLWLVGPGGPRKLRDLKQDTKLLDVDAGRILLRDPAGANSKVLVLNAAGRQIDTLPVNVRSAWLDGPSRVSTPIGSTLKTFDIASGRSSRPAR